MKDSEITQYEITQRVKFVPTDKRETAIPLETSENLKLAQIFFA